MAEKVPPAVNGALKISMITGFIKESLCAARRFKILLHPLLNKMEYDFTAMMQSAMADRTNCTYLFIPGQTGVI